MKLDQIFVMRVRIAENDFIVRGQKVQSHGEVKRTFPVEE